MAPTWLPRPKGSELLVDFGAFLGSPCEPKNHQKSTFSPKSRPRERFFIDFCCECRFSRFQVDFGRVWTLKIVLPPRREHDFHKITIFTFSLLGTPKWTQNGQKLEEKMPKITKIAKKVDFLRGRFFDDFLDGQKIEKRRHDHHRVISSPGPGLHWGTIGGTINQQPMNWLSNTPLGRWPGELINNN